MGVRRSHPFVAVLFACCSREVHTLYHCHEIASSPHIALTSDMALPVVEPSNGMSGAAPTSPRPPKRAPPSTIRRNRNGTASSAHHRWRLAEPSSSSMDEPAKPLSEALADVEGGRDEVPENEPGRPSAASSSFAQLTRPFVRLASLLCRLALKRFGIGVRGTVADVWFPRLIALLAASVVVASVRGVLYVDEEESDRSRSGVYWSGGGGAAQLGSALRDGGGLTADFKADDELADPSILRRKKIKKLPVPPVLSTLSNLDQPYDKSTETPYFWDVHFSGETIAERVFSKCHGLVQAAEHGFQQPEYTEDELSTFDLNGATYVNVDLTTEMGIARAQRLNLAGKRIADIIISPNLQQVTKVFLPENKGRMFALFRHPVDRAVGMYYYLSKATWDPMYNSKLTDMSLVEYAASSSVENNWMTRFLVGKGSGALTPSDMVLAKKIVREKVVVGLFRDLETSLGQFDRYFGWSSQIKDFRDKRKNGKRKEDAEQCRRACIEAGDARHDNPAVLEGSKEWDLIVLQNRYDMELYMYAEHLYNIQARDIFGVV